MLVPKRQPVRELIRNRRSQRMFPCGRALLRVLGLIEQPSSCIAREFEPQHCTAPLGT